MEGRNGRSEWKVEMEGLEALSKTIGWSSLVYPSVPANCTWHKQTLAFTAHQQGVRIEQ
jgi:hypothetical protein